MIVTFQDLYKEILRTMNVTEDTVEDANILAQIKTRINMVQDFLFYRKTYEWRKQRFFFTTKAPIIAGTISVTNGGREVTGSGTSWADIDRLGYVIVDNQVYKIDPHASISTTSLKLVASYPKSSASGKNYKIIFPDKHLDPSISSIVSIFIEESEKDILNANRSIFIKTDLGEPQEFFFGGLTDYSYYTDGTVTMTQDSLTVTGSGTTFTADMEGMPFRINEHPTPYRIQEVVSATQLTLKDTYQGDSGAGKDYTIGAKGSGLIHGRPVADDTYFVEIEALIKPQPLVRPSDISLLPDHTPLMFGCLWLCYYERFEKNPVKTNQSKANFRDSLKQFDEMYRVIKNLKWQSEAEIKARKSGASQFNPLERD